MDKLPTATELLKLYQPRFSAVSVKLWGQGFPSAIPDECSISFVIKNREHLGKAGSIDLIKAGLHLPPFDWNPLKKTNPLAQYTETVLQTVYDNLLASQRFSLRVFRWDPGPYPSACAEVHCSGAPLPGLRLEWVSGGPELFIPKGTQEYRVIRAAQDYERELIYASNLPCATMKFQEALAHAK